MSDDAMFGFICIVVALLVLYGALLWWATSELVALRDMRPTR